MKAYKYRLKTSAKIIAIFESWLALWCELYNAALQERRDAYRINRVLAAARLEKGKIFPLALASERHAA